MPGWARVPGWLVLVGWMGLAALAGPSPLRAQVPDTVHTDSIRPDTTDYTELFLKSQVAARTRVRVAPRIGEDRLFALGSRIVIDRDSLEWFNAETVGDLLTRVPGVFLWRGGWIGRPELPNYQARGATSVEYLLDGVPYLPLGIDSLSVDPSLFPLSFLDRIEVERSPGLLRVQMYTRRHDRVVPRSRVAVASGDFQFARYQGSLEYRFKSGFGFVVAAEHLAVPLQTGDQGPFQNTQEWIQFSYLPSDRFGAQVQLFHMGPKRDAVQAVLDNGGVLSLGDTLSVAFDAARTELQGRVFLSNQRQGLGSRLDLVVSHSQWSPEVDSVVPGTGHEHLSYLDQGLTQAGVILSHRQPLFSAQAEAWHRSLWTPFEGRLNVGVSPLSLFSANAEGVLQRLDGGRSARFVTVRGGLALPLRFQVGGVLRYGNFVSYPNILTDLPHHESDRGVTVGFEHPRVAFEVGYWRTEGFEPKGFAQYTFVDTIRPSGPTKWVTFQGRIAPRQWFILDGWYSNPTGVLPDGLPPTHSIVNATIQSKFLRTFPSGIFGLKLQGSMETWGKGTLGVDAGGVPVPIKGATFFRAMLMIRLGDFVAYYDRANLQGTRLTYLPGLDIRRFASTFGVRWEFSN